MKKSPSGRLPEAIVLVAGAGCQGGDIGIGRAIALRCAEEGALVLALDKNGERAEETARMITDAGGRALPVVADVLQPEDLARALASLPPAFSSPTILVNNVGGGRPGGILSASEADWRQALEVNLSSAFNCMRAIVPVMKARGGGSIVNIGSLHGIRYPGADMIGYCVAKAGLAQLSRCTAIELAPFNIRSNTLLVGAVDTPEFRRRFAERYGASNVDKVMEMRGSSIPLGKCATVWDVANATVFLASNEAAHITGSDLSVDGGAAAMTVPSYVQEAARLFAADR